MFFDSLIKLPDRSDDPRLNPSCSFGRFQMCLIDQIPRIDQIWKKAFMFFFLNLT